MLVTGGQKFLNKIWDQCITKTLSRFSKRCSKQMSKINGQIYIVTVWRN